jgi:predicted HTH transcriptional regulator
MVDADDRIQFVDDLKQDIPEYPEVALREVLVNAIAHADYSLTGMRIRVAIYADRMEIENPGMLPFGMTLDDLKAGVSRIRNHVVARVLRELGLLEEWGAGYRRITEDCRAGGYPAPEWEERGPALRVIFRPHPEVVAVDDETVQAGSLLPPEARAGARVLRFVELRAPRVQLSC